MRHSSRPRIPAPPFVIVAEASVQIAGEDLHLLSQLEVLKPLLRDDVYPLQCSEDVPSDRARAVAVAAVVHGEKHSFAEIVREGERAATASPPEAAKCWG